jgi:hypothetical protein
MYVTIVEQDLIGVEKSAAEPVEKSTDSDKFVWQADDIIIHPMD